MRLIDADELLKRIPITHADEFQNCRNCSLLDDWEVEILVEDSPVIDAVPVVRCKDCIEYQSDITWTSKQTGWCYCTILDQFLKPEDYCSYGVKRGDNDA